MDHCPLSGCKGWPQGVGWRGCTTPKLMDFCFLLNIFGLHENFYKKYGNFFFGRFLLKK
uniref:Uncharacterized protein n=1 Tax=Lepeophtheirus salmonis TaxID=72036 RepID=A0A0K2TBV5_LEPSM